MSIDVPTEMWTEVLKRITSVKDWANLQLVSPPFRAIIISECWGQVKALTVKIREKLITIEFNGQEFHLPNQKLLLLLDELGTKAVKIHSISLENRDAASSISGILERLTSASMKVEDLTLLWNVLGESEAIPLANFIHSIRGTLKRLQVTLPSERHNPAVGQAFGTCLNLESVKIDTRDADLFTNVLIGKTQLKSVHITFVSEDFISLPVFFALFRTDAHLTHLHFDTCHESNLREYGEHIQEQGLTADHPLRTLKTLTLLDGWLLPPLDVFPDLEQLTIIAKRTSHDHLNSVVTEFLDCYKSSPGECRSLIYRAQEFTIPMAEGPASLDEVVQLMVNPVAWAEVKGECWELIFIRDNASVKLQLQEIIRHQSSAFQMLLPYLLQNFK